MRMKYILNWYTVEMQYDNQFVLLHSKYPILSDKNRLL